MDILGTKDLIQKQFEELLEIIKDIASNNRKSTIQNRRAADGVIENVRYEAEISSFSDHILASHPADAALALQSLIWIAVQIHRSILERGLLIRGAITKGSLYHDGNIVLGEALNRAVYLEEEEAIYPRVIIDDKIISLFKSEIDSGSIAQDRRDARYFVSYINHPLMRGFTEEAIMHNAMAIKGIIEKKIIDDSLNDSQKMKWRWLAEEFNDYLISPKMQAKCQIFKTIEPINLY